MSSFGSFCEDPAFRQRTRPLFGDTCGLCTRVAVKLAAGRDVASDGLLVALLISANFWRRRGAYTTERGSGVARRRTSGRKIAGYGLAGPDQLP